jgi:hypothetical protein
MTPVTELKIASATCATPPEVRQRESRAVGASRNDGREGRKPPERRKTQDFRAMSGTGGNWRKPAETPAEVRNQLPEIPEMPEIHSAAHPVGETAKRRTGWSFGSTAAASRMRQAPPSSARRKKPAIADGSAETAETAQTAGETKWCSNIKRLGGRRRRGRGWPKPAQTAETPFRVRTLGVHPVGETAKLRTGFAALNPGLSGMRQARPVAVDRLRVGQADETICRAVVAGMPNLKSSRSSLSFADPQCLLLGSGP